MITDDYGWLRMVADGCGWLRMVAEYLRTGIVERSIPGTSRWLSTVLRATPNRSSSACATYTPAPRSSVSVRASSALFDHACLR